MRIIDVMPSLSQTSPQHHQSGTLSSYTDAGINGALTTAQKGTGATDSLESFTADIMKSGGGRSTPELVNVIVQKSTEVSADCVTIETERRGMGVITLIFYITGIE